MRVCPGMVCKLVWEIRIAKASHVAKLRAVFRFLINSRAHTRLLNPIPQTLHLNPAKIKK